MQKNSIGLRLLEEFSGFKKGYHEFPSFFLLIQKKMNSAKIHFDVFYAFEKFLDLLLELFRPLAFQSVQENLCYVQGLYSIQKAPLSKNSRSVKILYTGWALSFWKQQKKTSTSVVGILGKFIAPTNMNYIQNEHSIFATRSKPELTNLGERFQREKFWKIRRTDDKFPNS